MKRIALFLIIVTFLSPVALGASSRGLTVQNGKGVLVLKKGEKRLLSVRRGKTVFSRPADLTFFSDRSLVASVGKHSGIVRGNGYGEATILVSDGSGNTGRIKVKVVAGKNLPLWCALLLLPVIFAAFYIIKRA